LSAMPSAHADTVVEIPESRDLPAFVDQKTYTPLQSEYDRDVFADYRYAKDMNNAYAIMSTTDEFAQTTYTFEKIPGADVTSFALVADDSNDPFSAYAKDTNHVYWGAQVVKDADPLSFVPLISDGDTSCSMCSLGKDANHLYAGGVLVDGADPNSFKFVSDGNIERYAQDNNHAYLVLFHMYSGDDDESTSSAAYVPTIIPLPGSDSSTFEVLGSYAKDQKQVYYADENGFRIVTGADPSSFIEATSSVDICTAQDSVDPREVGNYFDAKDQSHCYFQGYSSRFDQCISNGISPGSSDCPVQ
jgi:hypothetical protein